jgi:hypothetical protein
MRNTMRSKAQLTARCCDGTMNDYDFNELYDNDREITYATFAKHVDIPAISEYLGYHFGAGAGGRNGRLRIRDDRCISFFTSLFRGRRCWHMDWSAIDHIFLKP